MSELDKVSERVHIIHERLRNIKSLMTEIMRDITWVESIIDRRSSKNASNARHSTSGEVLNCDDSTETSSKRSTGLAKPVYVSKELCEFMGISSETKISRVDVTRAVNKYIKDHHLQDDDNKRIILPDVMLSKLFRTNEPVSYLMLQKHLKHHYIQCEELKCEELKCEEPDMPISELTDDGLYDN